MVRYTGHYLFALFLYHSQYFHFKFTNKGTLQVGALLSGSLVPGNIAVLEITRVAISRLASFLEQNTVRPGNGFSGQVRWLKLNFPFNKISKYESFLVHLLFQLVKGSQLFPLFPSRQIPRMRRCTVECIVEIAKPEDVLVHSQRIVDSPTSLSKQFRVNCLKMRIATFIRCTRLLGVLDIV